MQKEKGNGAKIILALFLILLCIAGGIALYVIKVIWPVEVINTNVTIELGDTLDRDISYYVVGHEWSVNKGVMDWSGVNEGQIGCYTATYTHGRDVYTYHINVQDTTPPELTLVREELYYLPDSKISVSELVKKTYDISGEVTVSVDGTDGDTEISFPYCGLWTVPISAKDSSGNETITSKDIVIDTPPEISGMEDWYVSVNNTYSFGEGLKAFDDVDGDLTDRIVTDASGVDWTTAGEYKVVYSATDDYGLTGEAYSWVHIYDQDALDLLVANRTINRWDDNILGASNIYSGGSAATETLKDQEDFMLPSVVHVSELDSAEQYGHLGSGYIIDMDEEYVYIGSCQHVLKHADRLSYIYFYDGTKAHFEVIGTDKAIDVGFAKVKVEDLSEDTKNNIFCCQLDLTRFNECMLREGEELFFQLIGKTGYKYTREGISKGLTNDFGLIKEPLLWITAKSVAGNSGSGVFDEMGNLVGMVEGYHIEGNRKTYVAIPANRIYEQFIEITGRELFVK